MMPEHKQEMTADDVIRVNDQFYILSTSSMADDRTRVLKQGDTFAVFDRHGDMRPVGHGVQGLITRAPVSCRGGSSDWATTVRCC